MANQSVFSKSVLKSLLAASLIGFAGCSALRPRIPSLGSQNSQWESDHALIVRSKRGIQEGELNQPQKELGQFVQRVVGRDHPLEGVALFYLGEVHFRQNEIDQAQVVYFDAFSKASKLPQMYSQLFIPSRLFATRVMLGQMEEAQKLLPVISQGLKKQQAQVQDKEGFTRTLLDLGFLPEIDLLNEEAWDAIRLGQVFLFRASETTDNQQVKDEALNKFKTWHLKLQEKLANPRSLLSPAERQIPSPELKANEKKLQVLGLAHASLIDLSRYQVMGQQQDEFNSLVQSFSQNYQDQIHETAKKLPHLRATSPAVFKPRPLGL